MSFKNKLYKMKNRQKKKFCDHNLFKLLKKFKIKKNN